jgi:lysozyme
LDLTIVAWDETDYRKMRRLFVITGAFVVLLLAALWFLRFWIPNEPSKIIYPVRGIDVSHHQGDINWKELAASGIQFAYIKATEGADFKDVDFDDNWNGARAAKIVPGAYHFYTFGIPAHTQAYNFMAAVSQENRILPPAIDLEISGYNATHSVPVTEFQSDFAIFFGILQAVYHQTPVIYTTREFAAQ